MRFYEVKAGWANGEQMHMDGCSNLMAFACGSKIFHGILLISCNLRWQIREVGPFPLGDGCWANLWTEIKPAFPVLYEKTKCHESWSLLFWKVGHLLCFVLDPKGKISQLSNIWRIIVKSSQGGGSYRYRLVCKWNRTERDRTGRNGTW